VQDARRWVVATCADIGRPELIECAELGVSELVTNALLHGAPPIQVRVRGTREHPRIEVLDRSMERPLLPPTHPEDDDDLLLTFGRGLSIVARSSEAWGAEIESQGKIVWFNPAAEFAEDTGAHGVIRGGEEADSAGSTADADLVDVEIRDVPPQLFLAFQRHYRELRREVRLLALAHERDYPLAKNLSDLFGSLDRHLREVIGMPQIERALASGERATVLHVRTPRESASVVERFIDLLDLADDFCRHERLLSLERSPEQQRFQHWFLRELVRQGEGAAPVAWTELSVPLRQGSAR
jgi:two-component sensor histidine kinase